MSSASTTSISGMSSVKPIWDSPYGDEMVWRMADVYRKMVDTENNLAVNRRNWYIGVNTFLTGVLGLLWSKYCPCYLCPVLFLSVMGIIAARFFYVSSNTKYKAIRSILCRWNGFLYRYCQNNYEQLGKSDCPIPKGKCPFPDSKCHLGVNKDYIFPPVIGLFEEPKWPWTKQPVAWFWVIFWISVAGCSLVW